MKNNLRRIVRLCSPALVLAWGSALAQGPAGGVQLEPVVVTATRTPVPLRQVLADMTVLTREDLERTSGGIADVLRGVPGFEMVRNGGPGGTTSMFVRGSETRFTAVLIDGVRVDSQSTGGASWEAIPLSQIERIEILRGPASSVYGSDAIGGVVQIFTRKGESGTRVEVGLSAGHERSLKSDVSVSGANGPLDYALSVASERTDGFNSKANGNPDKDGHRSRSGSGRVGLKVTDAHRVELSALRSHVDSQYDGFTPGNDDHSLNDLETLRAQWTAQWTQAWRSLVSVGESSARYETKPSVYLTETRIRNAVWQNDVRFGAHTVNATFEQRKDRLDNTDLVGAPVRTQDQNAVALGYGWREGGVALQANVRHDRYSEFGSVNTGSLAAGMDVAPGWRLQSSVGNAFRAPTLYQRFTIYSPMATPLRPERARLNRELALRHRAGAFDSSVTVYRNHITDLILFSDPGPCTYVWGCYANVGNAVLKGVTLASSYATADGLRVSGSLDLQSPKNADTDKVLARRTRRHGALNVEKDFGSTTLAAQVLASARRFENVANTTVLGGYSVVNLDFQHRLNAEWRFQARIENLFDKSYQTANTYNSQPWTAFVGVRWSPKF